MKRVFFMVLTGILALVFLISLWQDTTREWVHYQREFLGKLARDERRGLTGGIKQHLVPALGRVDRCTTCHLAIEKPQLALAEEPYKEHPGQYLKWHPPERFGCTVCHGGQGLATEVDAAHGDVKHWDQPLLRGDFVQASCWQCHGNVQEIAPLTPKLVRGRALFEATGCYACHAVKDVGQTVSQDLTEVGSKPYLRIEADFEMMDPPHDRIHWLMAKLRNPRTLNPGVPAEELPAGEEGVLPSAMPHFGLAGDEVEAITVYLLSLTEFDPPVSYTIPGRPEPEQTYASQVEQGKGVFDRLACAGCHGAGGTGGRRNWNAGLGEEVPPLLMVKAYYEGHVEELKDLIRNGRQPVPRADPSRPQPGLYMPPWKEKLTEEELDALIAYLFSLDALVPKPRAALKPETPKQPTGDAPTALD